MSSQTSRTTYSPSLLWVLPVACSVWIGLFVDGWFARRTSFTLIHMLVDPIVVNLLGPGLIVLVTWALLTPANMWDRLKALAYVSVTSMPIIYLSHQRPGEPFASIGSIGTYYRNRRYLDLVVEMSLPQALLAVLVAIVCLLLLERFLTYTFFHRVPFKKPSNTMRRHDRQSEAYWNSYYGACSLANAIRQRTVVLYVASCMLAIAVVASFLTENWLRVVTSLKLGVILSASIYLCIWVAREFYQPLYSWIAILIGTTAIACWPTYSYYASPMFRYNGHHVYWISAVLIGFSGLICGISVFLLYLSNQMPRRIRMDWIDHAELESPVSNAKRYPQHRFWAIGAVLWGLGCMFAYWIPLNIDVEEFTREHKLSLKNGRLAARLLATTSGDRTKFKIDRTANKPQNIKVKLPTIDQTWMPCFNLVEHQARSGNSCWVTVDLPISDVQSLEQLLPVASHLSGFIAHKKQTSLEIGTSKESLNDACGSFEIRYGTKQEIMVELPSLSQPWKPWIEFVEKRARLGDQCELRILAPLQEVDWLESALDLGISVRCSLDTSGREVSRALISHSNLRLTGIHNAKLSVETWGMLESFHSRLLDEIVGCELPNHLPAAITVRGSPNLSLTKCKVTGPLLEALTPVSVWPSVSVRLVEPKLIGNIEPLTFLRFVYYGELLATPPFENPVGKGIPPVLVPTFVSEEHARWEVSTRPILLQQGCLSELTTNPINVPYQLGFSDDGQLKEFGLTPTRDCPTCVPWVTMTDVEHLYVNLVTSSFDNRSISTDPLIGEEIGFQVSAFPKLSRVTIRSQTVDYLRSVTDEQRQQSISDVWDVRYEQFLNQLLRHPGVVEIAVDCSNEQKLWDVLVKSQTIERLIVNMERDKYHDPAWLKMLSKFPCLTDVVVVDSAIDPAVVRMDMMERYIFSLMGGPPTAEELLKRQAPDSPSIPNDLEGEQFAQAYEKAKRAFEDEWTQLIQEFVPNVQVRVIPANIEAQTEGGVGSVKESPGFKSP